MAQGKTRLEIARKHLDAWLNAELEVTTHQSYTIGSRSLTKANLSEIRKEIEFWTNGVARLAGEHRKARRQEPHIQGGSPGLVRKDGETL